MNQSANLFQLQTIDNEIDRINHRLSEISFSINDNSGLITFNDQVSEHTKKAEVISKTCKITEEEIQKIQLKIDQSKSNLYSGIVSNPKELENLEFEIQSLKKRVAALEDTLLENLSILETLEAEIEKATKNLRDAETKLISNKSILIGEKSQLEQKLSFTIKARNAAVISINSQNLDRYNELRKQKKGTAVSLIKDSSCSFCGASLRPSEIQAVRSPKEMLNCSSCGRILYSG